MNRPHSKVCQYPTNPQSIVEIHAIPARYVAPLVLMCPSTNAYKADLRDVFLCEQHAKYFREVITIEEYEIKIYERMLEDA